MIRFYQLKDSISQWSGNMTDIPVLPISQYNPASLLVEGQDAGHVVGNVTGIASALTEKWHEWVEGIEDPYMRGVCAILLENQQEYAYYMQQQATSSLFAEATVTQGVSTFTKFSFPIVRGLIPNLVASEIVSVQPMMAPSGVVFYMRMVAGTSKGSTARGTDLAENADANYSSEQVEGESLGQLDSSLDASGTLSFTPVRQNTVTVDVGGDVTLVDDGNGSLTVNSGTAVLTSGTINYTTGAISVNFASGTANEDAVLASYRYDLEGSSQVPEIDVIITSSPVIARRRSLRSRISVESAHNLKVVHGVEADEELASYIVNELRFEIDREVINQLEQIAQGGTSRAFDARRAPVSNENPGVALDEHLRGFKKTLIDDGNQIFKTTKRAEGNFVIGGIEVGGLLEVLPGFVGSGMMDLHGVVKIGTIDGRWTCYKDPYKHDRKYTVGYKGDSFLKTGYILAFYVPLFATQQITLDDFIARRGIGTLYAKKVVDGRYYINNYVQTEGAASNQADPYT